MDKELEGWRRSHAIMRARGSIIVLGALGGLLILLAVMTADNERRGDAGAASASAAQEARRSAAAAFHSRVPDGPVVRFGFLEFEGDAPTRDDQPPAGGSASIP